MVGGSAHSNVVTNNADGGAGDDHITISGTTGFFTLDGTITNHATGGLGDDVLDATAILQSINSLSASNFLDGGAGNDVLRAYCFTDSDGGTQLALTNCRAVMGMTCFRQRRSPMVKMVSPT